MARSSTPERRQAFSRSQHPAEALLAASASALPAPSDDAGPADPVGDPPAEGGGGEGSASPTHPAPKAPRSPSTPAADEGKKQFVVRLPVSVHEALRNANYELREPMQAIAERALVTELKRLGFTP